MLILGAGHEVGVVRVRATSDGLQGAEVTIRVQEAASGG